ncbi:hypothetical protein [Arthrobacter sp. SPG23]|uniref:hypothetical protein n=1 Tax=Arthrobacter sp. SPG23 TaxID=1610703 RepID=UPI000A7ECCB2|nr:hypothetical protein [Arthrobacter sp. SPG23]
MMALAVVSTAQLALGLIGLRQALREGTTNYVWKLKGTPGASNETSGCWERDCLPLA